MRRSLQRRLLFASGALGVLVGAAFVILIVTLVNVRSQQRARVRSEEIISTANALEQLVLDLESDTRRYAIAHNKQSLRQLVETSRSVTPVANRLVDLSRRDPLREERARQIQAGAKRYANTWVVLVVQVAVSNPERAKELVMNGAGLGQEVQLRNQFKTFVDAEQARSDQSGTQVDRSEQYAIVLGGIGLGGSLVLIGLYAIFVSRRVVEPVRRVAGAAHRLAAGRLEERVDVDGEDEIGELARNFNSMAEAIETQQVALETQNRDLERLATELRSVLDSTVDAIVLTDLEGRVQLANRPMRRLAIELGMRGGGTNVVDQLLSIADKVADRREFAAMMERLRAHPEGASADQFDLADSSRAFVSYTAPVRGEGGLIGRIWTLREVTQERELDRLKDEFVATVSHELRTPLTSLMGFLEMLREGEAGELTAEQARFLGIVHRSSERLQHLVGDLLFVARLDPGGLHLQLEDGVLLDDVVAEALEAAGAVARSHDVELKLERNGEVPVRGDRERIGQLVSNLVSNAIKFTPAGGSVTARVFADEGNGVIEVEDTGIGIPEAEQERLFQRFFRASTATDRAIPGTGLGLAITKAITEAHDGRISFRSQPGKGTCFRIEIPL